MPKPKKFEMYCMTCGKRIVLDNQKCDPDKTLGVQCEKCSSEEKVFCRWCDKEFEPNELTKEEVVAIGELGYGTRYFCSYECAVAWAFPFERT